MVDCKSALQMISKRLGLSTQVCIFFRRGSRLEMRTMQRYSIHLLYIKHPHTT
jgi:hypothetical protein